MDTTGIVIVSSNVDSHKREFHLPPGTISSATDTKAARSEVRQARLAGTEERRKM